MWRLVAPAFEDRFRVILFDHAGSRANPGEYDPIRHGTLDGYTEDVLAVLGGMDLTDVIFVGHSVSAMIGVLAAKQAPDRFAPLVLVGPSPRYINDDGYVGGFESTDIDELLANLEANYLGWSSAMAPVIMGNSDQPALGEELTASFCATDPRIARQFAEVTFTSDNRADLPGVTVPVLVLQCTNDAIAPVSVGEYVAEQMPNASLRHARSDRALPSPQRSGTHDRRDQRVRRSRLSRERPGSRTSKRCSTAHPAATWSPTGPAESSSPTGRSSSGSAIPRASWSAASRLRTC